MNPEDKGVRAQKAGTGVYDVRGAQALAVEGWTIEGPQDSNGNRPYFIEADTAEEGVIPCASSRAGSTSTPQASWRVIPWIFRAVGGSTCTFRCLRTLYGTSEQRKTRVPLQTPYEWEKLVMVPIILRIIDLFNRSIRAK